jgi:phospholipid-binding lipoprotein MlaA
MHTGPLERRAGGGGGGGRATARVNMFSVVCCCFLGMLFIVCTIAVESAHAAPSSAQRDPSGTIFVDLTANGNAQPLTQPNRGTDLTRPHSTFVDLTKGDAVTARPAPTSAIPAKTMHTRHVDLSRGDKIPLADDIDDPSVPVPETDQIIITGDRAADPYEAWNRRRFKTHVALHRNVIDPVETVYVDVVPAPVRWGLHNFLTNLETPSVLANDVLQVDLDRASGTLLRFVINSTVGIAGIIDVATRVGIRYRDDDFGQTLANYGVGDYPYLLVPVIGPTNPRDLSGKVVDLFLNPLHYFAVPGGILTSLGRAGAHEIDKRSVDVGELDTLARTVPDPYAAERSRARGRRNAEINGAARLPP